MENLSIRDAPPLGAGPPPVPQLPPQMFTTAAQLLDLTDSEPTHFSERQRDPNMSVGPAHKWLTRAISTLQKNS